MWSGVLTCGATTEKIWISEVINEADLQHQAATELFRDQCLHIAKVMRRLASRMVDLRDLSVATSTLRPAALIIATNKVHASSRAGSYKHPGTDKKFGGKSRHDDRKFQWDKSKKALYVTGIRDRKGKDPVVDAFKFVAQTNKSHGQSWEDCKRLALSHMASCTAYRTAQIIHWCRIGGFFDEELLGAMMRIWLNGERCTLEFGPVGMSLSIQGLGVLGSLARRRRKWDGKLIKRLAEEFVVKIVEPSEIRKMIEERGFMAKNIAHTLHGLGLLFTNERTKSMDPQVRAAGKMMIQEFLNKAEVEDIDLMPISNGLHGCANLGFKENDGVMDERGICRLVRRAVRSRRHFKGQEITNVVWSLGKMGIADIKTLDMLSTEIANQDQLWKLREQHLASIVYGFGLLKHCDPVALQKICIEIVKEERLKAYNEHALSIIVYGLGRLSYFDKRIVRQLSVEIVREERLGLFMELQLANIVYGFGLLKTCDEEALNLLSTEVAKERRLKGFKVQELGSIVYGLGILRCNNVYALDQISDEIVREERLRSFQERNLANIVYGFGVMGYYNRRALDGLVVEISREQRLRGFKEQELANVVYGFGLLKHCNEECIDQIVAEISQKERLEAFKEQHLANMMYGFGVMGYRDSAALHRLMLEMSKKQRLRSFKEQEFANSVYGVGLVGKCSRNVLDRLAQEAVREERLRTLTAQGLANIIYAFGLVGYCGGDALDELAGETIKEGRLKEFSVQELSLIVHGFGRLGYSNLVALDRISGEIVKPYRLRSSTSLEIANILHGFGVAKYRNLSALGKLSVEIQRKNRLQSINFVELAKIVYSFGLLEYRDLSTLERLCVEVGRKDRIASFREQELANIVKGLGDVGYVDKLLMDELLERYVEQGRGAQNWVSTEGLGMVVISCAVLGHCHSSFLQFVRDQLKSNLQLREAPWLLCNVLWSFAVLNILDTELFMDLCEQLELLRLLDRDTDTTCWRQIAQAWIYLSVVKNFDLQLPEGTKGVIEKAMDAYREDRDSTVSVFEANVSKRIAAMEIPFSRNALVADGLCCVDILIAGRDPKVVIECDGPSHYSANKYEGSYVTLGGTLLRNRILEAHGYKVVSIPYFATQEGVIQLIESAVEHSS